MALAARMTELSASLPAWMVLPWPFKNALLPGGGGV